MSSSTQSSVILDHMQGSLSFPVLPPFHTLGQAGDPPRERCVVVCLSSPSTLIHRWLQPAGPQKWMTAGRWKWRYPQQHQHQDQQLYTQSPVGLKRMVFINQISLYCALCLSDHHLSCVLHYVWANAAYTWGILQNTTWTTHSVVPDLENIIPHCCSVIIQIPVMT